VTVVQFTVDLQQQELAGVRARDSYDARDLAMDAWGATEAAGRQQRLELQWEQVFVQEKPKVR
jgi:hypothetical protein